MYKRGFIKAIIIVLIAIVILGYVFHISILDILNNTKVQESLGWLWNLIVAIWSYVQAPIMYIWNTFVIGIIWNAVKAGLGL
jgi:hypothetical protein